MARFHFSFSALIVVFLALTTQSMADARHMTGMPDETTLCSGPTAATVVQDENGAPSDPAPMCHDCIMSFALALGPPAEIVVPYLAVQPMRWMPLITGGAQHRIIAALARGPPPMPLTYPIL